MITKKEFIKFLEPFNDNMLIDFEPIQHTFKGESKIFDKISVEELITTEKMGKCKEALDNYFKHNLVNGQKIKDYEIQGTVIVPLAPYFDEDYCDDKADEDIKQIGLQYGIKNLGWIYWCYGK